MDEEKNKPYDLLCIGGGIMSATLALMLKLIDPSKKVVILERLPEVAQESSAAWNNSGTGHSGFCELNYTPEQDDTVDISKAVKVFSQFERSRQFWAYLVAEDLLKDPGAIIHPVPHYAWVRDQANVDFLQKRYTAMTQHLAFEEMQYTEDPETMEDWFGLIMQGREKQKAMAATKIEGGTEVNFGRMTKALFGILEDHFDTMVYTGQEVSDLAAVADESWEVQAHALGGEEKFRYRAKRVFLGAGGGALPLLQKTDIEAKEGYGGFPVSGQWLVCKNRAVIERHHAKVYSKAGTDSPPMSAPHLDTRFIGSEKELIFGPFAGFSTKFLKEGSKLDLPKAVNFSNVPAYWGVFWHNIPLTQYLLEQVLMKHEDRMEELRKFIPDAQSQDWELKVAGQRVQVIKRDEEQGGVLEFGTDVVHNKSGTISALLGASPGASVAVDIMLEVLKTSFPEEIKSKAWHKELSAMIPFWNKEIEKNETDFKKLRAHCSKLLDLDQV